MASVNDLPLWEAEVSEILDVIPPPIGEDEVLKIHLSAKWFLKKKYWLIQVNRLHDLFFYLLDFITSAFVSVCLADANIHHSNHKAVLRIKAKDKILINKSRFLCPILTWFPEFKLLCGWYQLSIVKVIQFNLVLLLLPLFCMKTLPTNFNFDNSIFLQIKQLIPIFQWQVLQPVPTIWRLLHIMMMILVSRKKSSTPSAS